MHRWLIGLTWMAGLAGAQGVAAPKAFLVTDVRVSPFNAYPFAHGWSVQGDRYFVMQATMVDLIGTAYGVDGNNVRGGPAWMEQERYDVRAKVPRGTTQEDVKAMLRGMLAERFHLVVKTGSAMLPAYVLSVGAGKPMLTEADGAGVGTCGPAPPEKGEGPGTALDMVMQCKDITMAGLAGTLHDVAGGYLVEPVVDETKLEGKYNLVLRWTNNRDLQRQGAAGVTVFAAVEKQLGLRLELKSAPRAVFEVASVDRVPTANAVNIMELLPEPAALPFEVTVIKPSAPGEEAYGRITGGQIDYRALPLTALISFGWNVDPNDKEAMVGAPKWLDTTKFDVKAKAAANAKVDHFASGDLINLEDLRGELRAMMAERFGMKWHMEDRPVTAYTLVAVKPKLTPTADPHERTKCKEGPGPDGKDPRLASPVLNRLVTCQNMTVTQIGDELQRVANGYIQNTVVDGTGLPGSYDFTLSFSSADRLLGGDAGADPSGGVSVFDAVSRQLGLRLEKTKRPGPVLVIDHIEEVPTEN